MLDMLIPLSLPILLSTIIVYIATFVVNMLLPFHKNDFAPVPDEDAFCEEMRSRGMMPGQFYFPYASSQKDMQSAEWKDKVRRGPVGIILLRPNVLSMKSQLVGQFLFDLGIVLVTAYLASAVLESGEAYLKVFQVVGTAAFLGHAASHFTYGIWFGFKWRVTLLRAFEGLVYALLIAGVFGWLWPA